MRCFGAGLRMRLGEMPQIDAFRETVLPLQLLHQLIQHYEPGGPEPFGSLLHNCQRK